MDKKILIYLTAGVAVFGLLMIVFFRQFLSGKVTETNKLENYGISEMRINIPSLNQEDSSLPQEYTCDASGVNPRVEILDAPAKAKTLALVLADPDAPNKTFVHWLVWNIDLKAATIAENSLPANSVSGLNSGGKSGYYPPCPPEGIHRYIFTAYALDTKLNLPSSADEKALQKAMTNHIITQATLTSTYQRQ